MTAKKKPATVARPAPPCIYINGVMVPLPWTLPIFGHDYAVEVKPNEDVPDIFSEVDHVNMVLTFQRDWVSPASFLAAATHECNEAAKAHCDLTVTHTQLSVFAEALGPFLAAIVMAQ